jgi:hypothetical protein
MNFNNLPTLKKRLESYTNMELPEMFHVTTESSARKILEEGLLTKHMGKIHGSMEIQPQEPVVYISRLPNSNNLNTELYETGEKIVSLRINPECIALDKIYPDDGMFAAIGNEDYFETAEEIAEILEIPMEEAEYVYEKTYELSSDNVEHWKCFSLFYLFSEGEISVSHDIPKEYISFSHYVE